MSTYDKTEIYDRMLSEKTEDIISALKDVGDNTTIEDVDWAEQTVFIGTIHDDYDVKKTAIEALGNIAKNTKKIRKDIMIPYLVEQEEDEKLKDIVKEVIDIINENVD